MWNQRLRARAWMRCPTFTCSTPCCINRAHALSLMEILFICSNQRVQCTLCSPCFVLTRSVTHTQTVTITANHSRSTITAQDSRIPSPFTLRFTLPLRPHTTWPIVAYVENFRRFDAGTVRLPRKTCPVVRLRNTNRRRSPPRFPTVWSSSVMAHMSSPLFVLTLCLWYAT